MAQQHGIIGEDFGTELPVTNQDEAILLEEQKLARFSKTKEYRRLKEHLEQRIEYYQTYLPTGESVAGANPEKLGLNWAVANAIIAEFNAVISAYEGAREAVDARPRNT